jgi:sulfate adenylyltransferase
MPRRETAIAAPVVQCAGGEHLGRQPPLRHQNGFTVFLSGFSASKKSTIANALRERLIARTGRPVSLLDGDDVRRHLSSELGFSKAHRDLNVQRIGFVAAEITRHGGIAIWAAIAPYDAARRRVRAMIEDAGGFVLVHVSTPLEVCEQRDPKGLYARARAGDLQHFTGIFRSIRGTNRCRHRHRHDQHESGHGG